MAKQSLTLRRDTELVELAKVLADKRGMSVEALVEWLVRDLLATARGPVPDTAAARRLRLRDAALRTS